MKISQSFLAIILLLLFSCKTVPEYEKPLSSNTGQLNFPSFADTAEKVLPSVVHIRVINKKTHITPDGWDYSFNPFSPSPGNAFEEKREFFDEGLGSGVIIYKNGTSFYAVTNRHVISGADTISIKLYNSGFVEGRIVGFDERKDIAVVTFESDNPDLKAAEIGNSDSVRVGDWVLAVGSPFGFDSSVTAGIVSALGRRNNAGGNISDFIQTDASINTGNSGGALVNLNGELIGINSWITTTTGGSMGLGFAIPVNNLKKSIDDIIKYGEVKYGWIGVIAGELTEYEAKIFETENLSGVLIYNTIIGAPAYMNSLLPGDFIIEIDGKNITDVDSLQFAVGEAGDGKVSNFIILRDGKIINMAIELGLRDSNESILSRESSYWPGINILTIDKEYFELSDFDFFDYGVLVTYIEKGAVMNNFVLGDIITEINGVKIETSRDFYREINKSSSPAVIKYFREAEECIEEIIYESNE